MFLHRHINLEGVAGHHMFTCRCGSHDCVHVSYNGLKNYSFYEGYYMCSLCGTSLDSNKDQLCYYSPEFSFVPEPVQLSLF